MLGIVDYLSWRSKQNLCLFIALIIHLPGMAQIDLSPGLHSAAFAVRSSKESLASVIEQADFSAGATFQGLAVSPDSIIWIQIQVGPNNPSYLYLDAFRSHNFRHQLALYGQDGKRLSEGGSWIPDSKLSLSENRFALWIPPFEQNMRIYVSILPLTRSHLGLFSIQLLNESEARGQRQIIRLETYTYQMLLQGAFYGIILLILVIAIYQYFAYREAVYLFYIVYLVAIIMVYVRTIEGPFGMFLTTWGPWGKYLYGLETTIQYLVFGAYVFFLYHFLNLKIRQRPWIDYLFRSIGTFLFVMALLDLLIQFSFSVEFSRTVLHVIRLLFLPISFLGIIYLLIKFRSFLFWYILIGTSLLLIPASFTAFEQMAEGILGFHQRLGFLRGFTFYESQITIWMYNTRIGVLLEITCFGIGLLYRNKQVIEELKKKYASRLILKKDPFLERLTNLFEMNIPNERYNIASMCQDLGMSKASLYAKIKNVTGKTPILYLRALRLERGRELLLSTDQSISEIAYLVGYNDPNFFSRVFAKEFGMSPKRMREV